MRTAYLDAGYTRGALIQYKPDAEKVPLSSITDVFEAVRKEECPCGFVPIHNKVDKRVPETVKCLFKYAGKVNILGASLYDIKHVLGTLPNHSEINKILSMGTALNQCSEFLQKNYPNAERLERKSTDAAIREIAAKQITDAAAIGAEDSMNDYGLEVKARKIANTEKNKTRFILLGKGDSEPSGKDITSLIVHPRRDRIGLLLEMLGIISKEYSLNLSFIDSDNDERGLLAFYIDVDGHKKDKKVEDCISEISKRLPDTEVHILGSYPLLPFEPPLIKTIGHIGGTGKMGKWFNPFFEKIGLEVLIGSSSGKALSYEECIRRSNAVLVHAPMNDDIALKVVEHIAPMLKPGQLLVDNSGIKSEIVPKMLELTAKGVEVYSIHTMFNENIKSLFGNNIISVWTEKSGEMAQEFEDMLHKYGANITRTTPKIHDSFVPLAQSLEHVVSASKQRLIREVIGHPDKLIPYLTPNSRASQMTDGRIHNGDPVLYQTMLEKNPIAMQILARFPEIFRETMENLAQTLSENSKGLGPEFIKRELEKSKAVEDILKE